MSIPELDGAEALALTFSVLLNQVIFLLISFVALVVADAVLAGHGFAGIISGAWLSPVFTSLNTQPPLVTFGIACAVGLAFYLYAAWSERRGMRNEKARQEIITSRQGIAGEMPRLPLLLIVILMVIVGFSEELLFRFLLLGSLLALLSPLCGFVMATVIAVVISSIVFCLAHTINGSGGPLTTWLLLGVVLGATFALTNSLTVVALAHALYNIEVLVSARIEMHHDPNYFGGPIPTKVLVDSEDE